LDFIRHLKPVFWIFVDTFVLQDDARRPGTKRRYRASIDRRQAADHHPIAQEKMVDLLHTPLFSFIVFAVIAKA
jgi:hypothetical protein